MVIFHNYVGLTEGDGWLVVWNMAFIFPYIGINHPNCLSYFSEGWLNHQPEIYLFVMPNVF
jgi:hypothetical protein